MLNRSRTTWRYLDTGSLDPYTNMATDEAILAACAAGIVPPTLRLYAWSPPALSVGAFQRIDGDPYLEACVKHLPFVRRFTGGKAVWHDREITYSFVAPLPCAGIPSDLRGTYRLLGECFLEAFRLLGLEGRCECPRPSPRSSSPLCFAVRAPFEIVLDGEKVVGSAQRRLRHAFLQHGSILLNGDGAPPRPAHRDAFPPSSLGRFAVEQLKEAIRKGFEIRLGRRLEPGTL
ncbi:MAG: lipoate--protein ligase family protein, partial [Nitrospirae bacterium]|nr:lipoate--protein ligase family protein [Nitrospirota bacterium]